MKPAPPRASSRAVSGPRAETPPPDAARDLKTRIAWLYHVEGKTQDQVARDLGTSRSRALRLLAAARLDGTVRIRVTSRLSRCVELERRLETHWGLRRAIVIPEPESPDRIPERIGAELGAYVSRTIRGGMRVGLGWGATLSSALTWIEPRAPDGIQVVSMLGGLTRVSAINPSEFAWRLADRLAADCHFLAAPVFAPNPRVRAALARHSGVAGPLDLARDLDLAIVSVGDLTPESVFARYELLTQAEIASLRRAGAVGDVLCRFIDAEGRVIDHPVNDRVLAVEPRDLRGAHDLVLASGGAHKAEVLRAALRMLRPGVLITNEAVADRLARDAFAR